MSSDWIETEWGQLATLEYGKGLRDYQADNGIYPVYGTNGRIGSCDSCLSPSAGIVIGRKGAYRGVHYSSKPFFVIDTAFWLKTKSDIDLKWAYYQLLTQDINSLDSGSAIPSTTRGAFYSLPVMLPGLSEQKAIAHILGILDDKIELNRKTNETLEAIAKALFKSWFVDFDPVRAKAEGRPTGLPAEISDLFPDSFEESELGKVPRGWKVKPIGDVADCVGGSTPSTDEPSYWEGGKHWWATPKDLSSLSEPFLLGTARKITDAGLSEISSGVLPPGTVLLSSRAPVGYLVVATIPVSINQGFIALRPNKRASSVFLLNWCFNNLQQIKDRSSGTTFAEISKAAFRPIQCVLPPAPLIEAITQTIQPLYDRVVESMRESSSLSSMRDTLLPKLISGELRVPDAEALVAEAGI